MQYDAHFIFEADDHEDAVAKVLTWTVSPDAWLSMISQVGPTIVPPELMPAVSDDGTLRAPAPPEGA